MAQNQFDRFEMPRKEVHDLDVTRYKVYKTKREYVEVVAESAAEAMKLAKVQEPWKVVREFPLYRTLLNPEWIELTGKEPVEAVPAEAAPAVEQAAPETAATAETAAQPETPATPQ